MKTNEKILSIAREIVSLEGLVGVSHDAIARRLGFSKQAVLYWFPTKHDLLAALFLPALEAEAEAAVQAVGESENRDDAIRAFVRAIAGFHTSDLERFRMMYLALQTTRKTGQEMESASLLERVHPVTDRLYGALAERLDREPVAARREAVAIHSAVLGLLLMLALAESLHDPMKHSESDLIDALIDSLTGN